MSVHPTEGAPEEAEAAKGEALRYLTNRPRSAAEVRRRLVGRGHPEDVVDDVLQWLQQLGYVDDEKFAESWVENRTRTKPSGRFRLSRELAEKGVPDEAIDAAIGHLLPEQKERELALAVGTSRLGRYRDVPRDVARRRLGAFLMRRGFPATVVAEALRTIVGDRPNEGEETPPDD